MRVLVTGGAGFIGSHLCEALVARGDEVVAADDFDPYYDPALKRRNLAALQGQRRFRLVEVDVTQPAFLKLVERERPEAVVHLAARPGVRPSVEDPLVYEHRNVGGTVAALAAAAQAGVGHVVLASSSSVYGAHTPVPFREDAPCMDPESPYAASKRSGELFALSWSRLRGVPVTALRFFTAYGPRQRPEMAIHRFAARMAQGEPIPLFGDEGSQRDYTYISDIVDGVVRSVDRPPAGFAIYNLGSGRPVALRRMVALLEEAMGVRAKVEHLPAQPGDVPITYADVSKAKRELGFEPRVPLEEGLRRFVAWFRAQGR